jgi:hypothetical protein
MHLRYDWITMRTPLLYSALLLTVGFLGVANAPSARAAPVCTYTTPTTTQCERPGNAQINTAPPYNQNDNYPFGWPFWGWGGGLTIGIG